MQQEFLANVNLLAFLDRMASDLMGPPLYHGRVEKHSFQMSLVLTRWHPPILPFQQGRLER